MAVRRWLECFPIGFLARTATVHSASALPRSPAAGEPVRLALSLMSSVWIGFVGVIVGGLITTVWSWLAAIRLELSDAMVAARLVDENLAALDQERRSSRAHPATPPGTHVWEQNRAALARVLGKKQWTDVSAVYRHDHPLPEDSVHNQIAVAQAALAGLVAGKRYVVGQRWRNLSGR